MLIKKILLFCLLTLSHYTLFSQLNNVDILVGKTDSEVEEYFNHLNNLKINNYYKIERDVTNSGNLILSVDFSLADEEYYSCLSITCRFFRVEGKELCEKQFITGSIENASKNLNYIKDNMKFISDNTWEVDYPILPATTIEASFERKEHFFAITYSLKNKK